jgi:hypothetical protein
MQIPGVKLAVYKQYRLLSPDKNDGHVGRLVSGHAIIEATVEPGALVFGLIRKAANDNYELQKDLLHLPFKDNLPWRNPWQEDWYRQMLVPRQLDPASKVYGLKMQLLYDHGNRENYVTYPNNMLLLAEFVREKGQLTNRLRIWRAALVSQFDQFFFNVQLGYDTTIHDEEGEPRMPRFDPHPELHDLMVKIMPPGIKGTPVDEFRGDLPPSSEGLDPHEGIVQKYYHARKFATILTRRGWARVHFSDIPPRPRYRYLEPGELVRFERLGEPHQRQKRQWSNARGSLDFEYQAYEVSLVAPPAPVNRVQQALKGRAVTT